jgi:hypothetical protein
MLAHFYKVKNPALFKKDTALNLLEHVFGGAAGGANPVVRDFRERGVRRNPSILVALLRIVDITANRTFVFIHIDLQSIKNSKSEYRNPKQILNSNVQISEKVLNFGHSKLFRNS